MTFDPAPAVPDAVPPPLASVGSSLRPAPGRREIALLAGLIFFLNISVGALLQIAAPRLGLLLTQLLLIALPTVVAVRLFFLDRRAVLPFSRPRVRHVAAAILGTVALNHLLSLYGAWQERLWPAPAPLREMFANLLVYHGGLDFAFLLICLAIAPALCEETLFRGFVQSGLMRQAESPLAGLAATALVFGVFHLDPWRFVGVMGLGLFLGWLRQASGTLWPSILAHALNNTLSITMAAAGVLSDEHAPGTALTAAVAAGMFAFACLLCRPRGVTGALPGRML